MAPFRKPLSLLVRHYVSYRKFSYIKLLRTYYFLKSFFQPQIFWQTIANSEPLKMTVDALLFAPHPRIAAKSHLLRQQLCKMII